MQRKKLALIVGLLGILITAIVGFALSRRSDENTPSYRGTVMTVSREAKPLTVQDFPAKGIVLRHMGDMKHRQEAEYIFQSPPELKQVTNQYSFVIENISDKAIIALSIAYSFPKPGQSNLEIGTIRSNSIQTRLMGSAKTSLLLPGSKVGYCLALGQENLDFKNGIRHIQPEHPMRSGETADYRKKRNEAIRAQFVNLDNLLSKAERWVVEVEGAVFEDGTFVGTNRGHFFEQMNAKVQGAHNLAIELVGRAEKGETYASLVAYAQTYAKPSFDELLKPFGGSLPAATQDEAFNIEFSKNLVANRFIHFPEQEAMNYIRYVAKHWSKLTLK